MEELKKAVIKRKELQQCHISAECSGRLDASDISHSESLPGFSFHDFGTIVYAAAFFGQMAHPNSRNKRYLQC